MKHRTPRGPRTAIEKALVEQASKKLDRPPHNGAATATNGSHGSVAVDAHDAASLTSRLGVDTPLIGSAGSGAVGLVDLTARRDITSLTPEILENGQVGDIPPRWQAIRIFFQNKLAVVSVLVLAFIVLLVFLGPFLYHTNQTNTNEIIINGTRNQAPSASHILGTDNTGWDELGRIMYGGRYSLTLGFLAGLITIFIGTVYGMVAGFYGGLLDAAMMRVIDAALSIPYLFLLVALVTIFGPTNELLLLVIGLTGWWGNSRIIRGDALVIKQLEYSDASRSMGSHNLGIIKRHVFPNSMSNIVTVGTFSVADAILALSALGFIGLGVQSPGTDWGTMMYLGTNNLINGYWWETYPVAIIFVLVLLCINYIGDAMRDVFEVRFRSQ